MRRSPTENAEALDHLLLVARVALSVPCLGTAHRIVRSSLIGHAQPGRAPREAEWRGVARWLVLMGQSLNVIGGGAHVLMSWELGAVSAAGVAADQRRAGSGLARARRSSTLIPLAVRRIGPTSIAHPSQATSTELTRTASARMDEGAVTNVLRWSGDPKACSNTPHICPASTACHASERK